VIPLVDSDIILDVALAREPFYKPSSEFLDLLAQRPYHGMVAWHSISNIYYILRPTFKNRPTRLFIAELLSFLEVASGKNEHMWTALFSPMNDFEDAMLVAAAEANNADFIVTRNKRDFRNANMQLLSPLEAIERYSEKF